MTQMITYTPKHAYCYLPDGWDDAWKAAKATASTQPVTITGIGDSVMAGQNSTDIMVDAWWATLRGQLLNSYPLGGDFYTLLYTTALGGEPLASPPMVLAGTQGTDWTANFAGYGQTILSNGTAVTSLLTCDPAYAVVAFDIIWLDYATGTNFTYQVDGGGAVTVTSSLGNSTAAGAVIRKTSITGLANTRHTLTINSNTSGANSCNLLGVAAYASTTSGLRFANCAWRGMGLATSPTTHNNMADTTLYPADRTALYQGYQGTAASPTALTGFGFPTQPDLALIALGINDITSSGTGSTYRDALRRLVQSLRYGKSDACSIVIIANYNGGDGTTTSSTSVANSDWTGTQYPQTQDFLEAMRNVAREYRCAYVSVHDAFGRTPHANGWTKATNDVHPSPAGHAKMAALIGSIL